MVHGASDDLFRGSRGSAIALAVVSASQDVMVDAYRTDLMPQEERGAGAAAGALGYRAAMLAVAGRAACSELMPRLSQPRTRPPWPGPC